MSIRLYNTATRSKVPFEPLDASDVRMYVCGPTVYDRAHLGNARPAVVFDVLYRLLRHEYGSDHVTYVRNITDIDDKINARATEIGRPISEITDETSRWYIDDMTELGNLEPNQMPRATDYIAQMQAMITGLIARGHAYEAEGHVLFRVRSYADYGALSGRSVDDMIAGARVEVAPYKEDAMDFVLWKPSTNDLPGWASPWGPNNGRGRPGWHIECSAMARELLGETFDIHGGGNDLTFPHHENEIAQSRCMGHGFARVWMHNEMLQVEGKKMSKSLGNFFTVRDLLDDGVPGEVIRFVMLSTHYRKPMDWTERKREEAESTLRKWRNTINGLEFIAVPGAPNAGRWSIFDALGNDLNTPLAMKRLGSLARIAAQGDKAHKRWLKESAMALGLLTEEMGNWEWRKIFVSAAARERGTLKAVVNAQIYFHGKPVDFRDEHLIQVEALIARRNEAKRKGDFQLADDIRSGLAGAGIEVRDKKDGTIWALTPQFDASKLETALKS